MSKFALPLFILLTVGGGLLIGYFNIPGEWYAALQKPAFNPPNWVFSPVWTALYVLIGIAGWRIWRAERSGMAMALWWAQLGLNFAWSPVFFSLHQIGLALAMIIALLLVILALIGSAWRKNRVTAWLLAPYAAWVAFATVLNGAILSLNA